DGVLSRLGKTRPLVLILDDLHWAGKPTLLLLKHVLTSDEPSALLVVATYRQSELLPSHPLGQVLADLRREQAVQRLALRGLAQPDVVALVELTTGRTLS